MGNRGKQRWASTCPIMASEGAGHKYSATALCLRFAREFGLSNLSWPFESWWVTFMEEPGYKAQAYTARWPPHYKWRYRICHGDRVILLFGQDGLAQWSRSWDGVCGERRGPAAAPLPASELGHVLSFLPPAERLPLRVVSYRWFAALTLLPLPWAFRARAGTFALHVLIARRYNCGGSLRTAATNLLATGLTGAGLRACARPICATMGLAAGLGLTLTVGDVVYFAYQREWRAMAGVVASGAALTVVTLPALVGGASVYLIGMPAYLVTRALSHRVLGPTGPAASQTVLARPDAVAVLSEVLEVEGRWAEAEWNTIDWTRAEDDELTGEWEVIEGAPGPRVDARAPAQAADEQRARGGWGAGDGS